MYYIRANLLYKKSFLFSPKISLEGVVVGGRLIFRIVLFSGQYGTLNTGPIHGKKTRNATT